MKETTVERETTIEASPDEVWEALTEERRLAEWLAEEAEVDLSEGGEINFKIDGGERAGRIERLETGRELSFTWTRPGSGASLVEFSIEPVPAGTRVVVTERAPVPGETTASATADWWSAKLGALRAMLALVPA